MNPISLAGTPIDGYHICAFFNSRDEEYDILNPFFKQAVEGGEKNLHIVDPAHMDDHRARLNASGIDTAHCESCGQLELVAWNDAYLDDAGTFDKDLMLARIEHLTNKGRDVGFGRMRIMGNMGWAFTGNQCSDDLIRYEAEVNEVLARNKQPAVCVYDMAKLSGARIMDLLRTHPLTLINGIVQENPFFTPPAQMLAELDARAARDAA